MEFLVLSLTGTNGHCLDDWSLDYYVFHCLHLFKVQRILYRYGCCKDKPLNVLC